MRDALIVGNSHSLGGGAQIPYLEQVQQMQIYITSMLRILCDQQSQDSTVPSINTTIVFDSS